LYRDPGVFYLDYYGPPGTIRTIPYHQALNRTPPVQPDLLGKVVFVGAASSAVESADQADTYQTVYRTDSKPFSGVEIQATAFANLLRGETLTPVGGFGSFACLFAFSIVMSGIAYLSPRRRSGLLGLLLACIYLATAQVLFNMGRVLVPLA